MSPGYSDMVVDSFTQNGKSFHKIGSLVYIKLALTSDTV